jgi:SPX domain protein involved in polyphosphate accumulation
MVKFNAKLDANIVPAWSAHYLDYKMLKKRIKEAEQRRRGSTSSAAAAAALTGVAADGIRESLLSPEEAGGMGFDAEAPDFLAVLFAEADKVERFYCVRMRHAADEWAAHGIRVNAICPGYIRTALTD